MRTRPRSSPGRRLAAAAAGSGSTRPRPSSARPGRRRPHARRRAARRPGGPRRPAVRRPRGAHPRRGARGRRDRPRGRLRDERGQALQVARPRQAPHPRQAELDRGRRVPPVARRRARGRRPARARAPRRDGGPGAPRPLVQGHRRPRPAASRAPGLPAEDVARARRGAVRHGRAERDLLSPAERGRGRALGIAVARRLHLRGQGEPLRHPRRPAAGTSTSTCRCCSSGSSRSREPAKLGPLLWQLPADVPARRRPPRRGARRVPVRAPARARGPARELARRRGARAAARARRRARRRRPAGRALPPGRGADRELRSTSASTHGARGRRGNYSRAELEEWAATIRAWAETRDVYAYFNNDWEGFAPANARTLARLLQVSRRGGRGT